MKRYSLKIKDLTNLENLTWGAVQNDKDALKIAYVGAGHFITPTVIEDPNSDTQVFKKVAKTLDLEGDEVYLLKNTPRREDILRIFEKTIAVIILKDSEGNYFLGLTDHTADYSEELALAYMIIDNYVPAWLDIRTTSGHNYLSSEDRKELATFIKRQLNRLLEKFDY